MIDSIIAAGYTSLKMTRPAHYGLFNPAGDYKELHIMTEVEYAKVQLEIGNYAKNY